MKLPVSAVAEAEPAGRGWARVKEAGFPESTHRGQPVLKDVNGMSAVAFSLTLFQSDKEAVWGTSAGPF